MAPKAAAAKDTQGQAAYQQAMREWADEHNDDYEYGLITGPAAGSFLGLMQPVFELFQAPSTSPIGTAMPETLGGELLAPVFNLFQTAEQVENSSHNNGKF